MKEAIQKLVEGRGLTRKEAYEAIQCIMSGKATDAQISAFLVALRFTGETPDVVAGAAQAMREVFTPVSHSHENVVDTCGTGGDGLHTFNISTTAAFVTAGAGVPVAKHGNRSVSSLCGSADVLSELGIDITIPAEKMEECLNTLGIAFLFAPSLHPAMKYAIGPRREIGVRTLFNILGPISNPASARHGVLGVYNAAMVDLVANALAELDAAHLFVVHGEDGLDEITNTAATHVAEVRDGTVTRTSIHPTEFDLPLRSLEEISGGTPADNASLTHQVLAGEPGARREIVLLNAAAAICAGGKTHSIREALPLAVESIDSGAAREKLERLAEITSN